MKQKMYRHGDLLIMQVEQVKGKHVKGNILEEGEATGHYHRATGNAVTVTVQDDTKYISAPNGAVLTHDEHDTITLPPGRYSVWRQREFNPYEEAIRYVQD